MDDYEKYLEHMVLQQQKVVGYDTYEDYLKENDEFSAFDFARYKMSHILSKPEYAAAIKSYKHISKKVKKQASKNLKEQLKRTKNLSK